MLNQEQIDQIKVGDRLYYPEHGLARDYDSFEVLSIEENGDIKPTSVFESPARRHKILAHRVCQLSINKAGAIRDKIRDIEKRIDDALAAVQRDREWIGRLESNLLDMGEKI